MQQILAVIFFVACSSLRAQVVNNDIVNLTTLKADEAPISSSTKNSTVQWACINKALTSKCISYHNDQWFQFVAPGSGQYFINVSEQQCAKKQGIQIVVIEGNPCITSTYKVYTCIPKINLDDGFLVLDSLKKGEPYLLNIDGFLGDVCDFNLQLSTEPKGLPIEDNLADTISISALKQGKIVTLAWTLDDTLTSSLRGFEIWRRASTESKSSLISGFPLRQFSFGSAGREYHITDTVEHRGLYTYTIIAPANDNKRKLLGKISIEINALSTDKNYMISLPLNYRTSTPIQILVIDELKDIVLKESSFDFDPKSDTVQKISTESLYNAGVRFLMVKIINHKTNKAEVLHYLLSDEGVGVKPNAVKPTNPSTQFQGH